MTPKTHHMRNHIDAVDPMVMALRTEVEKVLSDAARFRFDISVTEALTNLVTHAPRTDAPIEIGLSLGKGRAVIEIFDVIGAPPFDLRSHATDLSDVDAMAEGGRGLGLIMECADRVNYGPSGTRNSLSLEFWDDDQTHDTDKSENGVEQ